MDKNCACGKYRLNSAFLPSTGHSEYDCTINISKQNQPIADMTIKSAAALISKGCPGSQHFDGQFYCWYCDGTEANDSMFIHTPDCVWQSLEHWVNYRNV